MAATDRHRFGRRAHELRAFAERMVPLAKMPDRATSADLQLAADLGTKAASDLDELVAATPPGCICRHVKDNDYDYLDYAEACLHHRQLYTLRESLKANYAKMERALKNEARMRIVLATLTGAALNNTSADKVEHEVMIAGRVANALNLADEVRALVEMVCLSQGPNFTVLKKIKLYEGVLLMLRDKGIS